MLTVVVVPTYNEAENIQPLVKSILDLPHHLQVVIVDDHSPDGTGQLADDLARTYPTVQVIHRPGKLGLGTAHIAGIKRALMLGAERVLTMDADFSHQPHYIPQLIELTRSVEIAIGCRYIDGGGTLYWGLARRSLSRGANTFARLMLGLQVHDCTGAFRCFRREVLEALDLDSIFSEGYSFLIEMIYRCEQQGFRIGEVPIIFADRRQGQSKISRQEIFKAMYTVLRLSWEKRLQAPFPVMLKDVRESHHR